LLILRTGIAKASLKRGKLAASITSKIDLAVVQWQLRRILAWFAAREEVVRIGRIAIVHEILEGERASMLYNQKRRGMASHLCDRGGH
jgi:hypothetical protein